MPRNKLIKVIELKVVNYEEAESVNCSLIHSKSIIVFVHCCIHYFMVISLSHLHLRTKYLNINCLELLEEVREGGEATEAGQGEGRNLCIYRKRYRGIWI